MRTPLVRIAFVFAAGMPLSGAAFAQNASTAATTPTVEFVDPADPALKSIRHTGDTAIAWLGNRLVRDVTTKSDPADPAASISACHLTILGKGNTPLPTMPSITAVKCTSLRLNNPANAPDAADQLALERVQSGLEQGQPPDVLVQKITHGAAQVEWRVYRPLAALPSCLQCHGNARVRLPEFTAEIQKKFPEAKAVDYKAGEWRGLIRVSISPDLD